MARGESNTMTLLKDSGKRSTKEISKTEKNGVLGLSKAETISTADISKRAAGQEAAGWKTAKATFSMANSKRTS